MNNEKWNEICFLLSDNIRTDISENDFEQNVVQALRVLDWKEYSGDIEIRPSFQIGAANRITPDFVIKSTDNKKLFVIEIKQPNIPLNSKFQQQLFSYMRQNHPENVNDKFHQVAIMFRSNREIYNTRFARLRIMC